MTYVSRCDCSGCQTREHAEKVVPGTLERRTVKSSTVTLSDRYSSWNEERRSYAPVAEANLVSSRLDTINDMHAPVLDLDFPAELIPSSTPGHFHLYLDTVMTWRQYKRMLKALVRAGVIEKGFYQASKHRGETHVRLPWVKKNESQDT